MQGVERSPMATEDEPEVHVNSKEFGGFSLPLSPVPEGTRSGGLTVAGEREVIDRAVRNKWAIPVESYERLPTALHEMAMEGGRDAVKAAAVLVRMSELNQVGESTESSVANVVIFIPDNGRGES